MKKIDIYRDPKSGALVVDSEVFPESLRRFITRFVKPEEWQHTSFMISDGLAAFLSSRLKRVGDTVQLDFSEFINQIGLLSIQAFSKKGG